MLATFIIGLREGVEAALIVGIIAAFLRKEGRADALRPMWLGVTGAIAICVAVGVALQILDQDLPQRQQEGLETIVGTAAVGVVTFMIVWMRRHARDLSGELRARAGDALVHGSTRALIAMAFFAVIREGLETVVFLLAVFQNATDPTTSGAGAVLGLLCAVAIGALVYRGGMRINLARFFRFTGAVLVLVAAGLVVSALHTAHEAGWLNAGQGQALDLSWLVVPGTWTSALLTGMLGWQPQPVHAELIGFLVYLVPAATYVLWPARGAGARRRRPTRATAALTITTLLAAALVLGACGSKGSDSKTGGRSVALKLTDAGCDPATVKIESGRYTFDVTNGGTSKVSELEIMKGARILGEKENLVEGLQGSFTLTMNPGTYVISCPGGSPNAKGVLTVTGKTVKDASTPQLVAATAGYKTFVSAQAETLLARVKPFVAAVKSGDVAEAKKLFPTVRVPYETIEPVAESFGDLDPQIDARVNDVKKGEKWTGFHRIEQALWKDGSTKGMDPIADQLLTDVTTLRDRTKTLTYQPDELVNGANDLLTEVATSKITGEEDRYSHTDLYDFEANVIGSQKSVDLLAPALRERSPDLVKKMTARFAAVRAALAELKKGGAFPSYDTVGDADRKHLSDLVQALAKPVAQLSGALDA